MLNFYTNICNYIGTRYESGTNYEQRASLFARKYLLPYIYIYIPLVLFLISTRFLISSWWYHHRQEGKVFPCNSKNRLLDTNDHPFSGLLYRGESTCASNLEEPISLLEKKLPILMFSLNYRRRRRKDEVGTKQGNERDSFSFFPRSLSVVEKG